jgi:hypothetical protein
MADAWIDMLLHELQLDTDAVIKPIPQLEQLDEWNVHSAETLAYQQPAPSKEPDFDEMFGVKLEGGSAEKYKLETEFDTFIKAITSDLPLAKVVAIDSKKLQKSAKHICKIKYSLKDGSTVCCPEQLDDDTYKCTKTGRTFSFMKECSGIEHCTDHAC